MKTNRRWMLWLAVWLVLFTPASSLSAQGRAPVDVLTLKGIVDPLAAQYIVQGINAAEMDEAQCLVLQLDTPGGSMDAMRDIVQAILNASVPVVVYVAPSGARAGSAGVFITLAANIAVMAPGTNIGAAHPVGMTGEITGTMNEKVTNDAAAYARAIAEQRGRNADWAEKSVRESVSVTAQDALDKHIVDLIADSLPDLLQRIDGETVTTADGPHTLHTAHAPVQPMPMSLAQQLLHLLINPNVAYLLFTLGIWAIIAEFYHPGAIIPGVSGVISLILAFVAFGNLPINWGGIALIVLAIVLFILDIKVTGYVLSIGGVISFVLGSLMLFSPATPPSPTMPALAVSPWIITGTTIFIAGFFLFALSLGLHAQRSAPLSGVQTLVGAGGVAVTDLAPEGSVQVRSELWSATSHDGSLIPKGRRIKVVSVSGLHLTVAPDAQALPRHGD